MKSDIAPGIPDDLFIRGDVPFTKEEVRTVSISKLRLKSDSVVLDIGAGTGTVSIETARLVRDGIVYAVERSSGAVDLINKNIGRFKIKNIRVLHGTAPGILKDVSGFDRVFIGGSGGSLREIFAWIDERIPPGGRIVVNAITLDTLAASRDFFGSNDYAFEIIQLSVSRCESTGKSLMLRALNPVFVISAEKIKKKEIL